MNMKTILSELDKNTLAEVFEGYDFSYSMKKKNMKKRIVMMSSIQLLKRLRIKERMPRVYFADCTTIKNKDMENKYYLSRKGGYLKINEAQAAYIEANNERLEREVTNWWAYKQLVYET